MEKRDFERTDYQANRTLAILFSVSALLGSLLLAIVYSISPRDYSAGMISAKAAPLAAIGLLPFLVLRCRLKPQPFSWFMGMIISGAYVYLMLYVRENGGITVWSAAFIFLAVSLLFVHRDMLLIVGATVLLMTVYMWLSAPEETVVRVSPSVHVGRLGILAITIGLALYANAVFRRRLRQQRRQIREITEKKQEIEQLYEEIVATEDELRTQNSYLAEARETIHKLAFYDERTGLPNRHLFRQRLEGLIATAGPDESRRFSVYFVELGNYKQLVGMFGHAAGDAFIAQACARIVRAAGDSGGQAFSLGDDEFVVLAAHEDGGDERPGAAERILAEFEPFFDYGDLSVHLTASVGYAMYPQDGGDAQELLKNAELAMSHARKYGVSVQRFQRPIRDWLERKLLLQEALMSAVARQELELHYQPIIDLAGGRVNGFEALLRWNSKAYGMISPAEFVPLAEENGSIVPIGYWVLETACRKNAELNAGGRSYTTSVNISAIQLKHRDFLPRLRAILEETGVNRDLIVLEVTESLFIDALEETRELLGEIRALGLKISLDDFGTGYSSLAYLKRFPIDILKVDRLFVSDMIQERPEENLVESIIQMAHRMRMRVVAEGIETAEQYEMLRSFRCDRAQGYFFSKPIPGAQLADYLRQNAG